jgi:hypothetical protein
MTTLTGQSPGATYGDLLTFTNSGSGVSPTLNQIQDGLGNNTAIQLSTTQFKINDNGVFIAGSATTEPPPVAGGIYFDTGAMKLMGSDGIDWYPIF